MTTTNRNDIAYWHNAVRWIKQTLAFHPTDKKLLAKLDHAEQQLRNAKYGV